MGPWCRGVRLQCTASSASSAASLIAARLDYELTQASSTNWLVLALSCAVGHCLSVAGLNVQARHAVRAAYWFNSHCCNQRLISATSFTVRFVLLGRAASSCVAVVRARGNTSWSQVIVNTSKAVTLIMGVYLLKEAANASTSAGPAPAVAPPPSLTLFRNVFECGRCSHVSASKP